jgi:hypothetical protein
MTDLSFYVVHSYLREDGRPHWHVVGKYIEAIVKPPLDVQANSKYLTAKDLGLKDTTLQKTCFWTKQWLIYNGREDPRAEFHTAAYIQARCEVSVLSQIVDAAVKKYYERA